MKLAKVSPSAAPSRSRAARADPRCPLTVADEDIPDSARKPPAEEGDEEEEETKGEKKVSRLVSAELADEDSDALTRHTGRR